MGTSKGYQAPTSPQWRQVKFDVTRASGSGAVPDAKAHSVLSGFIRASGGSGGMSGGGGAGGGGGAVRRTGQRLGRFAGAVASVGLTQALEDAGLGHLIGKSAGEIALSLVNELCGDGSTLEEVDARKAMSDVNSKLLEGATTYEEVVQALEQRLRPETLGPLLLQFFGYYLYHRFCRVFFERVTRRHGPEKASSFLASIRNFIESMLRNRTYGRDLTQVAWAGPEGNTIAQDILKTTLEVFER